MKRTSRDSRKRVGLLLVFAALMTIITAGQLFAAPLSSDEEYWLNHMREEEKLARDVYTALYDKWGLAIFYNISKSEQTHMNAIKTLLDRYNLADPAQGPGVFTNPDLQDLYDALLAQGKESLIEALKVGITIEETDIGDLTKALDVTTHKDIKNVCTNLRAGSYKHLNAFNSTLATY